MTYAFTIRAPLPIEVYDASHAEIMRSAGEGGADGLILHMARVLPDGFEVLEIWQSREHAERFNREVVVPALERVGVPADAPEPELTEFEPRVVMALQVYDWAATEVEH
jgi:hypothetical protein